VYLSSNTVSPQLLVSLVTGVSQLCGITRFDCPSSMYLANVDPSGPVKNSTRTSEPIIPRMSSVSMHGHRLVAKPFSRVGAGGSQPHPRIDMVFLFNRETGSLRRDDSQRASKVIAERSSVCM
jgi:hypothetical protein